MRRRDLLTLGAITPLLPLAARAAAPAQPPIIKPRVLREGATVGLITPSYYVSDPDRLLLAQRTLEYFGLKYKMGRNVAKRAGYTGGTVEERVSDLHDMFRDPSVDAVFCIRGGYGTPQLLDAIDYDLIRRNPKIFLGYSDITAMHIAIHQKTGLVTFHGPMPLARFTPYTQAAWKRALFNPAPIGPLTNPPGSDPLRPGHILRTVTGGRARGRLIGGNLTLICALMGTPYEIDTRGMILFTEDTGEDPYRIDRMLMQLRLAGKLQAAAGIVWGECNECVQKDGDGGYSTGEVIDRILKPLGIPVLSGLTIGHTEDQLTLPEGVIATLDADHGQLIIEESAFSV